MILACLRCGSAIPVQLQLRRSHGDGQDQPDVWMRQATCHRCHSIFAVEVRALGEGDKVAEVRAHDRAENKATNASASISTSTPASASSPAPTPVPVRVSNSAPSCPNCGLVMQRAGSCYSCKECGTTSGCA